jgi:hypothetical protein
MDTTRRHLFDVRIMLIYVLLRMENIIGKPYNVSNNAEFRCFYKETFRPNPYLPRWEYIPDGEPRLFEKRVYIYGSHDTSVSDKFCDYKLKVWSAPMDNLNHWSCHGDAFHTRIDYDHESDTPWTDHELYAPDVIEKDGKYYRRIFCRNVQRQTFV